MGAPAQFRFPDVEDAALFRAVREKWHPHLDGYYIALVFRDKPRVLGGRKCAATARCVPDVFQFLLSREDEGLEGIVEVYDGDWDQGEEWQEYLLDHELCHFAVSPKSGKLYLIDHDVTDFRAVLERHDPAITGLRSEYETRVEYDDGDED